MQPRHHFSKAAPHYTAHRTIQKDAAHWVMHHAESSLLPLLNSTHIMLDAGCGTGALATLPTPAYYIGIDHAEGMCQYANTHYDATLCADIHALPFADNSIKGAVSSLCWQWCIPLSAAIEELYRVMQHGGRAVITLLSDGTMQELAACYDALHLPSRLLPFVTQSDVLKQLNRTGFTVLTHATFTQHYTHPTCWDFFKQLKGIGAHHTAIYPPLSRPNLNRVIAYYEAHFSTGQGVQVTYAITGFVIEKH
jgi:malonyl-CoA O-methyltransferase